jgi:excinuclease ABC subunit A
MGACPKCDGLGVIQFFDPKRVVAHPELSLAAGAIRGWDRRNQFYFQMLTSLAEPLRFDIDTPFERAAGGYPRSSCCSAPGGEDPLQLPERTGRNTVREHTFEGIIPNLERRYKETDSVAVREELSKYRSNRPARPATAPACARKRATCASAGARTLHEISRLPLGECA